MCWKDCVSSCKNAAGRNIGWHNESTISNIYRRNTLPTIATLEAICKAFGITLSQFFADGDMVEMTPDVKELLDAWIPLTQEQKRTVLLVAKSYGKNK